MRKVKLCIVSVLLPSFLAVLVTTVVIDAWAGGRPKVCYENHGCFTMSGPCSECVRRYHTCGYERMGYWGVLYVAEVEPPQGMEHYAVSDPHVCFVYRACTDPNIECPGNEELEKLCTDGLGGWLDGDDGYTMYVATDPC